MPRIKKPVEAVVEPTPEVAKVEVTKVGRAPEGVVAIVIEDAAGREYRRFTKRQSVPGGPDFVQAADAFLKKHNEVDLTTGEYKTKLAAKVTGYYIEKVAKGQMSIADYRKLEAAGIAMPGGEEYEESWVPARPLKAVSIRG